MKSQTGLDRNPKGQIKTRQQSNYETAYACPEPGYGMPDHKIGEAGLCGKRILTIGCGIGSDVWYLAGTNEVVGIDYASSASEVARLHQLRIVDCDLNANPVLPFADSSFDIVVIKDILEHLLDPLAVLQQTGRVLKDGGYAVISVPNHFYWPFRLRYLLGGNLLDARHRSHYDEWDYMHIRFFSYGGFRRFLTTAGFQPIRWFWDFGNLAHYREPDMWFEPQLWKQRTGRPLSRRGRLGLYVLRPAWRAFNVIFPRSLRRALVSVSPGLLCAGFYVHAVKQSSRAEELVLAENRWEA